MASGETTVLPMLSAARLVTRASSAKASRPDAVDHSAAIAAMCKTLNATVTKLLFSFTALQTTSECGAESASSSIANALAASKREELQSKIVEALAGTVERVVRCDKAAIRSSVLRDIRARFTPPEVKKVEMIDQGVQTAPRKPSMKMAAAAVAAQAKAAAEAEKNDDAILRQLRGEEPPPPPAAAQMPPAPATTDASTAAAPSTAGASARTSSAPPAKAGEKPRPVSAQGALPGIYERQMQWAARAAEKREAARVQKENREREGEQVEKPKASNKWAHVESVMRRQRLDCQEEWKMECKERVDSEIERREQAEQKFREEREARERMAAERDRADQLRAKAEKDRLEAHSRMVEAEKKYQVAKVSADEMARRHAEELEIRSAFGEGGLEIWPMFPGRKVHRVLESDHFDGRVSAEFRVKDAESGERGVTLLMGRLAAGKGSEAQAVLFDTKYVSDLDAARWWESNAHRFEKAKERALLCAQRAQSAGAKRSSSSREPELT